jgi:hypothetical protein
MRTLEFEASLEPDRTLKVPPDVVAQVEQVERLRVILVVPERDEDEGWAQLAAEEFLRGYDESDAIYDELSPR